MIISIILVEPQLGENIGASARAMKNFGLHDLRIVNPRDGWPNTKAVEMSVGALDIIESAKIYPDLLSATSDLNQIYALTARERDMNKPHIYLQDSFREAELLGNIGFLFGRENSGLTNLEIAIADKIVTIDTNPNFSSLNIAQSVGLVSYELFKISNAILNSKEDRNRRKDAPCDKAHLNYFYDTLVEMLDKNKFFKVQGKRDLMVCNIKNIFARNNLSKNELQTLIGIIKNIVK